MTNDETFPFKSLPIPKQEGSSNQNWVIYVIDILLKP